VVSLSLSSELTPSRGDRDPITEAIRLPQKAYFWTQISVGLPAALRPAVDLIRSCGLTRVLSRSEGPRKETADRFQQRARTARASVQEHEQQQPTGRMRPISVIRWRPSYTFANCCRWDTRSVELFSFFQKDRLPSSLLELQVRIWTSRIKIREITGALT